MAAIRKGTVEDASSLASFAEKTFRATFEADNSLEDMNRYCQNSFGEKHQLGEILDTNTDTFLYENESILVGYIQLCWHPAPSCLAGAKFPSELRRLYVLEDFHGRGVAQELIKFALEEVEKRKSEAIWLGVWEKNARALAFYKKLGFDEIGEKEFLLGSDLQRDIIVARHI